MVNLWSSSRLYSWTPALSIISKCIDNISKCLKGISPSFYADDTGICASSHDSNDLVAKIKSS